MNAWFLTKVKFTKQLEDGTFKRVTEQFLVAAMTFSDAETRIFQELGMSIRGEFIVHAITRADFHEIFHFGDSDVWYKCKITYESSVDMGGESSKAKKVSQNMLVTAHSVDEAHTRLKESLQGMMADYSIPSVSISPIMDIFPFNDSESPVGDTMAEKVNKDLSNHELSVTLTSTEDDVNESHTLGRKTVFSAANIDHEER